MAAPKLPEEMIAEVNKVLARVGDPYYPSVIRWAPIPRPDDADYAHALGGGTGRDAA